MITLGAALLGREAEKRSLEDHERIKQEFEIVKQNLEKIEEVHTVVFCRDENRDFNQMNIEDMETLVRRDRNHPVRDVTLIIACAPLFCTHGCKMHVRK